MMFPVIFALVASIAVIVLFHRTGTLIDRLSQELTRRLHLQIYAPVALMLGLSGPLIALAWTFPSVTSEPLLAPLAITCRTMVAGGFIVLGAAWMVSVRITPSRSIRISAIVAALALFLVALVDSLSFSDANLLLLAGAAWLWWQHEQPVDDESPPGGRATAFFPLAVLVLGCAAGLGLAIGVRDSMPLIVRLVMLVLACSGLALVRRASGSQREENGAIGHALTLGVVLAPVVVAIAVQAQILSGIVAMARQGAAEFGIPMHLAVVDAFSAQARFTGLHILSLDAWGGLALAFFAGLAPSWGTAWRRIGGVFAFAIGVCLILTIVVSV